MPKGGHHPRQKNIEGLPLRLNLKNSKIILKCIVLLLSRNWKLCLLSIFSTPRKTALRRFCIAHNTPWATFHQFLIYRSYLFNEISSCLSCLNIVWTPMYQSINPKAGMLFRPFLKTTSRSLRIATRKSTQTNTASSVS